MLRKVLATSSPAATAAVTRRSVAATAASSFKPTRPALIFQNNTVQNQWTVDSQTYTSRRSDYDFDKEAWAKQMKFASFDCIMEPSITPPKYTSFDGIKKNIRRYLNMKKLTERRPGYSPDDLKELFVRYKYAINSKNQSDSALLLRLTTHTEASRIEKDIAKRANEDFKSKSWASLRMDIKKKGGDKKGAKSGASATSAAKENGGASSSATGSDVNPALASAANNANDVVLLIKRPDNYDIHVSEFAMVTSYMAQMSAEDWLQMTFKCEYFEKTLESGETVTAPSAASASAAAGEEKGADVAKDKAAYEKSLLDKGYTKVLEYPCFEVRMGDGAAGGVQYPFIVLGVMRRDGTRYGRDAQDAASLRKQFDRNSSWFS